eukprot:6195686-Amphidinium_carterae.1
MGKASADADLTMACRHHLMSRTVREELYLVCETCVDAHPKQLQRTAQPSPGRKACVEHKLNSE